MSVTTFWETPFAGPFGNWWCLPCWCLGGLSILFRWSLVSLWWCVRSVLTESGDFGSCCGVLAVFRGCLVGIEGMVFSCFLIKLVHLSTQKSASKKTRNFAAIGVVCWVNSAWCFLWGKGEMKKTRVDVNVVSFNLLF